jgi:hypothetical protein
MVSFELFTLENKKNIDIRPGYGLTEATKHNLPSIGIGKPPQKKKNEIMSCIQEIL